MDDFELAYGASRQIGDIYKEGKTFSNIAPAYALTQLRGLAALYCNVLDRDFSEDEDLFFKINSLDRRGLLKPQVRRHLRALRENGNKGAHPEKYDFQAHDFPARVTESIQAALALIESIYLFRQQTIPNYETIEITDDGLKEACYRAVIAEDIEAIHLIGIHFKEKADHLKREADLLGNDCNPVSTAELEKAMIWFKQGSKLQHPDCMYHYGIYQFTHSDTSEQLAEGEQLIRIAAEAEHADASVFLATSYLEGSSNFIQNEEQAHAYFEIAARQGHPQALSKLGAMYAWGTGCERDDAKAVSYSIRAAELGFPEAQFNLFVLYRNGQGVEANLDEALKWLVEAAEQEFPAAINSLGFEIRDGSFPNRPARDALDYFERSMKKPAYRARASQAYAALMTQLDDNPESWEKAAWALQVCYETITRNDYDRDQDLIPYCLGLAKTTIFKLRNWLGHAWSSGDRINSILLCTLFNQDGVPEKNRASRFSGLRATVQRLQSGSKDQKAQALLELLREGGIESGAVGQLLQSKATQIYASLDAGRNEPCPCGSGHKFKKCHGT